jgi:hypothetical protein
LPGLPGQTAILPIEVQLVPPNHIILSFIKNCRIVSPYMNTTWTILPVMRAFAIAPLLDMATLAQPGWTGAEGYKKEEQGTKRPTMPGARWAMGTMDIKLDKDFSVILISRYQVTPRWSRREACRPLHELNQKSGPDSHPLFRCLPHCSARVVPKATVQASRSSSPASSPL